MLKTAPILLVHTAAVNALDDYEEGTWTPSIIGSGTAGTVTYAVQNALYKKVGTCVTIQFHVIWSSGTGTGDLRVSGLPFVAAGTGNQVYFTAGYSANVALTANYVSYFAILDGTTVIQVDQYEVGGGTATNVPYDAAGTLGVTMSYFV